MHGETANVGIKELSAGTTCSQAGETEQGEAGEKTSGHLALTSFQVPGSQYWTRAYQTPWTHQKPLMSALYVHFFIFSSMSILQG